MGHRALCVHCASSWPGTVGQTTWVPGTGESRWVKANASHWGGTRSQSPVCLWCQLLEQMCSGIKRDCGAGGISWEPYTSLCMYLADLCRAQPQGWAKAVGAGWLSAPCACDRRAGCVCWERGLPGNTSSASLLAASEEPSCSSLTSLRPSYQHDRSSSKISKQNLGDSHQITSFKR